MRRPGTQQQETCPMLYNPAWRDPAPLTLPKLIAWLERQPAARAYSFENVHGCALVQYLKFCGYPQSSVGGTWWREKPEADTQLFSDEIGWIFAHNPWTYGAALSRARAALADAKMTPAEEPVS